MPTALDFLKAKVKAVKHTLESKSSKEKQERISIQTAQDFNTVIEEIKKRSPTDCCGTNATLGYNWSGRFVPSIKEASSSGCLRA